MILSDRELRELLLNEGMIHSSPIVRPLDDPETQIQPAGVDVRLGNKFLQYRDGGIIDCCRREDLESLEVEEEHDFLALPPGEFVLGRTIETIRMPFNLIGRVEGRSSLGRLGVVVHATAGFIDPGFEGVLTLELFNYNHREVKLYPGMRIAQVVFCKLSSPAVRPYGHPDRKSKYQGDQDAVGSRLWQDFEEE